MNLFNKICIGIIAVLIEYVIHGYVFMKLWEWLIVYSFNINTVNVVQSIGIIFFLKYLIHKEDDKELLDNEELLKESLKKLTWLMLVLSLGYTITLFQ
jgi:hypothetical protein